MGRFSKLETGRDPSQENAAEEIQSAPDQSAELVTYDQIYKKAEELFYIGEYKKALRYYSRSISEDDTQVEPWAGQVMALLMLDQIREADVWAKRAQQSFAEHPSVLAMRAMVFARQGMGQRALGTLDYAMGKGETDVICWIARAAVLLEGDNKNWEFCFDKVTERCTSGQWRKRALMGLILERHRKWPQAVSQYHQALADQTGNFFLWNRLGNCYHRLGFTTKSIEAHKQAISLNPNCSDSEKALRKSVSISPSQIITRIRSFFLRVGKTS